MITIERATLADKPQWLPLWQAYLSFYEQDLAEEITDLTFARCLDDQEPMTLLLAFDEGVMVGFSTLLIHRSSWAMDYYAYLEDLYVDESHRGKGVARALIEAVAEVAKSQKAERLYWVTDAKNKTAQGLYDKVAQKTDFIQYRRDF